MVYQEKSETCLSAYTVSSFILLLIREFIRLFITIQIEYNSTYPD